MRYCRAVAGNLARKSARLLPLSAQLATNHQPAEMGNYSSNRLGKLLNLSENKEINDPTIAFPWRFDTLVIKLRKALAISTGPHSYLSHIIFMQHIALMNNYIVK